MNSRSTALPPDSPLPNGSLDLAERPVRLRGLRVGLLDCGAALSAGALRRIALRLRRDHGAGDIQFWRKGLGATHTPLFEEVSQACDVALCGVGLCRDTVSSSVWAAIALERRGIATATLIGTPFGVVARAVAQKRDFPALPMALLAPPAGDRVPPDSATSELGAADEAARLLTAPRAAVVQEFLTKLFPPPVSAGRAG